MCETRLLIIAMCLILVNCVTLVHPLITSENTTDPTNARLRVTDTFWFVTNQRLNG